MNFGQLLLILLVCAYRCFLSPLKLFVFGTHASCRFTPSCSAFALEAIAVHGALRGSVLSAHRICRCHPWGGCGNDPVPSRSEAAVWLDAGNPLPPPA
ncbi:MAG: membrane protein insertion efficiency factor YidD [Verrucomicrobia bacterium]|nr:membrane protein insertion efficiency factor YidD [Verrucomicrobiota bacterium]